MSSHQIGSANLSVRHLRDVDDTTGKELGPFNNMAEAQAAGYDTLDPATGIVQIGVEVDGAFFPLDALKAGLFFQQLDAARQQQQQQEQAQQAAQQSGTSDQPQGTQPQG